MMHAHYSCAACELALVECPRCRHRSFCPVCGCWRTATGFCPKPKPVVELTDPIEESGG
jgi:hypothetical protein